MKPVLRDHCHVWSPVLKDHILLTKGPTFQHNWTCHQKRPVLRDHISMAKMGWSFKTGSTVLVLSADCNSPVPGLVVMQDLNSLLVYRPGMCDPIQLSCSLDVNVEHLQTNNSIFLLCNICFNILSQIHDVAWKTPKSISTHFRKPTCALDLMFASLGKGFDSRKRNPNFYFHSFITNNVEFFYTVKPLDHLYIKTKCL